MITDADKLVKLQDSVRRMINDGRTADEINTVLAEYGESPESMRILGDVGAETLAQVRQNANKPAKLTIGQELEALSEGLYAGERAVGSLAEEYLKDYSGGLYGELYGKEGYEKRKKELKESMPLGKFGRGLESTARGLAGAYGTLTSPLFKAGSLVGGAVGPSLFGNSVLGQIGTDMLSNALGAGLYKGTATKTAGEDWGTTLKKAGTAAGISALLTGALEGGAQLATATAGASTGVGYRGAKEIQGAGTRRSKAFWAGREMSDSELADEARGAISKVQKAGVDALTKGKASVGQNVVNKADMYKNLQNGEILGQNVQEGRFVGSNEVKGVYDTAEKYIKTFDKLKKPTVEALDRLRRNVGSIDAPTGEALAARTEIYNTIKGAGDAATGGQYSEILKPYELLSKDLKDLSLAAKDTSDVSKYVSRMLRGMKTESGRAIFKKVLGQETYDKLLGKLTEPWFTGRGALNLIGGLSSTAMGAPTTGLAVALGGSPRIVGDVLYLSGKLPTGAANVVGKLGGLMEVPKTILAR